MLECTCACRRDGHEQAAARLRVTEHHLVDLGSATPVHLLAIRLVVAPAAGREQVALRQVAHAFEERNRTKVDVRATFQVGEVTDQPVTGDISRRGRACGDHRLGGQPIEGRHHGNRCAFEGRRAQPALDGRRHET